MGSTSSDVGGSFLRDRPWPAPEKPWVIAQRWGDPPGSLERWLTARHAFYSVHDGAVYRAEVDHEAWPSKRARPEILENTVARAAGVELPGEAPLLHFSRGVDVHVWLPERVR